MKRFLSSRPRACMNIHLFQGADTCTHMQGRRFGSGRTIFLSLAASLPPSLFQVVLQSCLVVSVCGLSACLRLSASVAQGHMVPSDKLVRNAVKAFIFNDYHAP